MHIKTRPTLSGPQNQSNEKLRPRLIIAVAERWGVVVSVRFPLQSLGGNLTPSPVRDAHAWQPFRVPAALEEFKSLGIPFDLLLLR
jgi:hypothetical protein